MQKSNRARLIEMEQRNTPLSANRNENIYLNGNSNLFPYEVETVIINSATAYKCAEITKKYLAGAGLVDTSSDVVVDRQKGIKLSKFIRIASKDLAYHGGVFIHVVYGIDNNGNIVAKGMRVLDYSKCRISKFDDNGNSGKVIYKDFLKKNHNQTKKEKDTWFYPFCSDEKVILEQIRKDFKERNNKKVAEATIDEMIRSYRGQVFYLNLSPEYIYALPKIYSVYNDADTEYRIGLYNNKMSRTGFVGKTIIVKRESDEEEAEAFDETAKNMLGVDNADSLMIYEVENTVDDLDQALKVIQIEPQFDDKLFSETRSSIKQAIIDAYGVPELLVSVQDNSLFGASAEAFINAEKRFDNELQFERQDLEDALTIIGFPCKILTLTQSKPAETSTINETE